MQWLASSGHCSNLYSDFSHFGVGNVGRYWTQNFATFSDATVNPLMDGSHYLDATRTAGELLDDGLPDLRVEIRTT